VRRPEGAELRRHLRLNVTLPALRESPEGQHQEKVVNLSASGLALATASRLSPGAVQRITLLAPDPGVKVTLDAVVVRVHADARDGGFVAGMRFTVLDAQTVDLLTKLMLSALGTPSGKRASPRLEVTVEVFWASAGYVATSPLQLLNVSHAGALLNGTSLPGPGTRGLLSLRPDEGSDLLTVPAEIVWRREEDDGTLAGIRFGNDPQIAELVGGIVRSLLLHRGKGGAPAEQPTEGTRIGGFELGRLLFRGRSLEVYAAQPIDAAVQTAGAQDIALKRFHGVPLEVAEWTERFLAAARIGAHLHNHPGVVRVYSAIADTQECWLATELVNGKSLEEGIRAGLPVGNALATAQQVLATLEDCHHYVLTEDGGHVEVLHGDLRPGNVLLTEDGAVKLTGFGSAFERLPERLSYLPPEILAGTSPSPQSDVYQAGVLLYEALTGVLPFAADTPRMLMTSIAAGPPPPSKLNTQVPQAVDALVLSALAADPAARPQGAGAFAEALSQLDLKSPREVATVVSAPLASPAAADPGAFRRGQAVEVWEPLKSLLEPGDTLGRYEVLGKLAEGGMAELYLARSPKQPEPVVIKTILPSRAAEHDVVTMFMTEARVASQIDHPNVVRISDVGFDRNSPFIVMEYFPGRTLIELILALSRRQMRMPPAIAARIIADCCEGLHFAHTLKDINGAPLHIVHRDVTSKNVQVGYSGDVKLLDFGIARAAGVSRLTRPGHVRGTAAYVSPEQITGGRVSAATDVWALGVNLYLMLTGAMPFGGKTDLEVLKAVKEKNAADPRQLRVDAPEPLARAALRALQKAPGERYESALAMRDEVMRAPVASPADVAALVGTLFPKADPERLRVEALLTFRPHKGPRASSPKPVRALKQRSSGPWIALAAAVGGASIVGAVLLWLLRR
jgi:serine/threonine protein kinase